MEDHVDPDARAAGEWYEQKTAMIVDMLGPEHDMVMHALIPFALGGSLDLYYFPHHLSGTAIATKELSEAPGEGSRNREFDNYELVMFTREPLDLQSARDLESPFGAMHSNMNRLLNLIALYSASASLNGGETCEFPLEMPEVGGKCLIFDSYASRPDESGGQFGLLAIIEIFRSEMDYAREHGGAALLEWLKDEGLYPYSDLDRPALA